MAAVEALRVGQEYSRWLGQPEGCRVAYTSAGRSRTLGGMELLCRRRALGMNQEEMAWALAAASGRTVRQVTVSRWETGERDIPPSVRADVEAIEASVDRLEDHYVAVALGAGEGRPELRVPLTDEEFWAEHPGSFGLPSPVIQVAAARAQARLARGGVDAPICDIADPA